MSIVSSSPSPSPTPSPNLQQQSSPSHQYSTKPGALVSAAKSLLSEQYTRLSLKHQTDIDLLEDLRNYIKNRCQLERDYLQSLIKINQSYSKRYSSSTLLTFVFNEDENSDIKTLYSSWKIYQDEMEKQAKIRQTQFEQLSTVVDTLKSLRTHKIHIAKKCLDNHLKKMHEEIINSVNEIDKTRKLYFEEEHLAKQARDKEEKIKKRKTGIFSSFTNLQNKKERTSAQKMASDIQSTSARNDYLMALAAGNAHFEHYYNQDLLNLMLTIDDCILDKCRHYMLNLLNIEKDSSSSWYNVVDQSIDLIDRSSADFTNQIFLKDPNSSSLSKTILYEFQSCDNDTIDTISLDHNADIALRNEGQKWFTWFSKECRNLNRLSAQLVKLQALLSEGHKTVELPGSNGQVDIESRIDEIRQQIRKCEISKLKAKARLQIIKDSGADVEDFISFELQVANEIKQQSLDVDNLTTTALSRTPSMRSHSELENKLSSKSENESISVVGHQNLRPESSSSIEQLDSPDREILQMGTSIESTTPAPTSAIYSAVNQMATATSSSWGDYDPMQAWDNEPTSDNYNNNVDKQQQQQQINDNQTDININNNNIDNNQQNSQENYNDSFNQQQQQQDQLIVDGFSLIGKQCFVLYNYQAQNDDELTIVEQEILNVINAADKDWVQAQNNDGKYGYVPASYLQEMIMEENYETTTLTTTITTTMTISEMPNDLSTTTTTTMLYNNDEQQQQQQQINTELNEKTDEQTINNDNDVIYVQALYDYVATNNEEISFKAGDLIKIIDQNSDDGWWTGQTNDGHIGHFPSMLVSELDNDDDDDEENEEEDEESNDEDNENAKVPLPPPSINLPPPLPSELIDKNKIDEKTNEISQQPSLPPPPPPPPKTQILGCDDDDDDDDDELPPFPPPPPPPPNISSSSSTATTVPILKPMQLMAPQAVVIIQPTPEIESQPVIGYENFSDQIENQQNNSDITDNDRKMDKKNEHQQEQQQQQQSVCVSIAIAAHEISESITQQAIDDSMRELERRRSSTATNGSNPPTTSRSSIDAQNNLTITTSITTTTLPSTTNIVVTNGEISHDYNNNNDDDEDMK